jgi:hypothetical protein
MMVGSETAVGAEHDSGFPGFVLLDSYAPWNNTTHRFLLLEIINKDSALTRQNFVFCFFLLQLDLLFY